VKAARERKATLATEYVEDFVMSEGWLCGKVRCDAPPPPLPPPLLKRCVVCFCCCHRRRRGECQR
jgi:hypothetical protein